VAGSSVSSSEVTAAAPNTKFRLALPERWNGKAATLGGAGLDGFIPPLGNASNLCRTRPLCLYPSWPKYHGSGDVDNAGSFACASLCR
jgi:hypothetical protein